MRIFDAILNGYFVFLVLLFLTGGYVPSGIPREDSFTLELSEMDNWVAGFLLLLLARRLLYRRGPLGKIAFVRFLRHLGDRLTSSPSCIYAITAIWGILLAAVAIRRHLAFAGGPDIDIFDQALWNTTQGRFYRSSIVGGVRLLSEHFDPLQLVLVPFYLVYPSPVILLTTQALMLALGAIPLYWLARDRFPGQLLAPLFPILYLLYQPLRAANRNDYHPGALVPPLFLFALYFMEKARWRPMVLMLVLAGLLKEQMAMAGVTIGIYLFFARRQRRLGAGLAVLFGLWFYANFAWIIPAFKPAGGGYKYFSLYSTLGGTQAGTFFAHLLDPGGLLRSLTMLLDRKLMYVFQAFGQLAFLSFLSPSRLFLGLPFLAEHLLTDAPLMTTIWTHHTADLLPFIFFSALAGVSRLLRWLPAWEIRGRAWSADSLPRRVAALLLATTFLFHGWSEIFHLRLHSITPHHEHLYAVLASIPPDASVSAQTPIAPHLSYRKALYHFPDLGPNGGEAAEFVILDRALITRNTFRKAFPGHVAALGPRGYETVFDEDGILIFRRAIALSPRESREESVERR
jgi:uncharacterized membrane protein